jgi:(p)ppGpp synthase/HD superfamily hydrolase
MSNFLQDPRVLAARDFADAAHRAVGQVRKFTREPYIVHPEEVARLVALVPHTAFMLMAAYLHDTLEDTQVTARDLEEAFGPAVAQDVQWLTDVSGPQDGNRRARKALDLAHISQAPAALKTVKLADIISNVRSIARHDARFARVYFEEKRQALEVLREGDSTLWAKAAALLAQPGRAP